MGKTAQHRGRLGGSNPPPCSRLAVVVRRLVYALLLFLPLVAPPHAEARRTVRAAIYNFQPLLFSEADGSPQGFFVKMLNRVAQRENWEVEYVPGTWQAALDRLKADQVDLVLCVGYTPERAKIMDFPKEFLVLDWGLVYKAKGSHINTIMDLEGKRVAGLKGSVFSAGFLELTRQFQLKVNFLAKDQLTDVFQALDSGAADAGVTSNIPGILNEAAYPVDRTPIIFTPVKLGFAVNAGKNGDLLAALDRDIAELKADRDSPYYRELGHLYGKKDNVLPKEAYWVLAGICGVLLASFAFIVVLRRKVAQKTAEVNRQGNLMRSILNGTTDAVFIKDPQGRYIVVNDEVVRLFGLPREEILGRDDTRFFPAAEAQLLRANDCAIMDGGEVVTSEEHITTLGEPKVYLATKGPVYDDSGALAGLFGISRDITGIKLAELELHRNTQLLGRMGEIALVGGWEIDLASGELFWSGMMRRLHEVQPSQAIGLELAIDFYAPQARPVFRAALDTLIATGAPFDLELPLVTAKGRSIWVRTQGEAEYSGGAIVKVLGSFQDITERKQMEEQLRQSNEQLRFVLEGSQLGFWDWDMQSGKVARNERWAEMLGYTLQEVELTVTQWTTLMHPEDQGRAWQSIRDHLEGRAELHEVEYRLLAKDGSYRWILDRARIVKRDANGNPIRMSGTHTDITDRKRMEEEQHSLNQQLHHAQRLESLGVLSGGIAHDFNNILAIIIGHCGLAKLAPTSTGNSIAEIERAAERAADLCRQMLAYAGKSQFIQSRVDMEELVDDMVKMIRPTVSQKIEILTRLAPDLPEIDGDVSQLRQIVMNLVINASEAIGTEQGQVRLTLGEAVFDAGHLGRDYLGKAITPGRYLCLEVADDGCGMDGETIRRIFEPFYTTKFTGRGLGMSAVLGIITSHQGALQLASEPGSGTTFRIYLPVGSSALPESAAFPELPSDGWRTSGTALLVEDEDQVRLVARALLEGVGFQVLEACNGREALEVYRRHSEAISLVLTDIGMPVMDGYELLAELKRLAPTLPVVVSSGFGDIDLASRLDQAAVAGTISKPYTAPQFREAVRAASTGSAP